MLPRTPWQPSRKSLEQILSRPDASAKRRQPCRGGTRKATRQPQSNCSCLGLICPWITLRCRGFAAVSSVRFPYQKRGRRGHQRQPRQSHNYGCNQNHWTFSPGHYHKERCQHGRPRQAEEHDRIGWSAHPGKHHSGKRPGCDEEGYDQCGCHAVPSWESLPVRCPFSGNKFPAIVLISYPFVISDVS